MFLWEDDPRNKSCLSKEKKVFCKRRTLKLLKHSGKDSKVEPKTGRIAESIEDNKGLGKRTATYIFVV